MLRKFFEKLLTLHGKTYSLDENIPSKLLFYHLQKRFFMLGRGIFFCRRRIFLGKKVTVLHQKNIVFGKNNSIDSYCFIDGFASQKIQFGDNVSIGAFSTITCTSHLSKYGKGLKIGNNSSMGRYTEIGASGGIEIGDNVIMGSYISFHSENHNFENPSILIREQGVTSKGIKIGNNVWVGAKVTFLDGSEIGNNCVIAAGSVVKGVFPDNVVIGGIPAKIIKQMDA